MTDASDVAELKTKKITVCVTGEYNEDTKEITGGEDVKITVGEKEVKDVAAALDELKPADSNEAGEEKLDGEDAEIVQLKKEKDELEAKKNTDGPLSEADQKKFDEIQAKIVALQTKGQDFRGGGTRAKRRRPKRTGTKKKKHTKRQKKKGRKTKKC